MEDRREGSMSNMIRIEQQILMMTGVGNQGLA